MNERKVTHVCIVYPTDPSGVSPGGIDPFIRGILQWAPDDLNFSMIGVTTDPKLRPVGEWTICLAGDRSFEFLPIVKFENSGKQNKIPLTVRFMLALFGRRRQIAVDVLEFHRIEPCLAFLRKKLPMTVIIHQDMQVLKNRGSDIRWKHVPSLYFKLEDYIMHRVQSIFCVRENAANDYRLRFPDLANHIHFTPTWADTEKFSPPRAEEYDTLRGVVCDEFDFPRRCFLFVWVGRLDSQKNPILLINAFAKVHGLNPEARLLIVGDGILRDQVERCIETLGVGAQIALCGLKSATTIARYLKAADLFVLSSAYEGMPICVLEALASGLPVASTDVGEVNRVVHPGVNGELTSLHEPDDLAEAMLHCMANAKQYRGAPCYAAVEQFSPQIVLHPIYENYRRLGALPQQ